MKKFLSISLLFLVLSSFAIRQAQTECPFGGRVNCTGQCGLFEDKNGDGFCDHGIVQKSESPKTDASATITSAKKSVKEKAAPKTTVKNDAGTDTKNAVSKTDTPSQATTAQVVPTDTTSHDAQQAAPAKAKKPYSLILISAITLALYAFTAILVKTGKMRKATHRRIWNVVLLITGLVSCLLGFFLVIQLNYHVGLDAMRTIRYYHVQFGIAMTIVAVIHILWHLNYFKSIFAHKKAE